MNMKDSILCKWSVISRFLHEKPLAIYTLVSVMKKECLYFDVQEEIFSDISFKHYNNQFSVMLYVYRDYTTHNCFSL